MSKVRTWIRLLGIPAVAVALMAPAAATDVTTADFCWLSGANPVTFICEADFTGTSQLVRNDAGLTITVDASEVTPGDALTLWWFVIDGDGSIVFTYGAGHVVGNSGEANFAAHLPANVEVLDPDGNAGILTDPTNAIVFPVIRTHGPMIPELLDEQIQTFDGGCNPGDPNEGICEDIQSSAHYP